MAAEEVIRRAARHGREINLRKDRAEPIYKVSGPGSKVARDILALSVEGGSVRRRSEIDGDWFSQLVPACKQRSRSGGQIVAAVLPVKLFANRRVRVQLARACIWISVLHRTGAWPFLKGGYGKQIDIALTRPLRRIQGAQWRAVTNEEIRPADWGWREERGVMGSCMFVACHISVFFRVFLA